jgi:hypothetical protein
MKHIALAVALAFGSTLAMAESTAQKQGATDGSPQGNVAAGEYWKKHSKQGYMTRDHAMSYKGADNKPIDWKRLNTDADERVSEAEWTAYHNPGATRSDGTKDAGADDRGGGAAGRTGAGASGGANVDAGVSSGASGSTGGNLPQQPKDSDPTSSGRGSN